jgi:aldehyde dehydrogenase (NAD+)
MTQLSIDLTALNGRTWSQSTGLFINNEFVESQKGKKLATIDPAYVSAINHICERALLTVARSTEERLPQCTPRAWKMLNEQSSLLTGLSEIHHGNAYPPRIVVC